MVINGDIWTDFDFSLLPDQLPAGILAHLIMVDNPAHNLAGDFALKDNGLQSAGDNKLTFSGVGVYHRTLFDLVDSPVARLGPLLRQVMDLGQVTGQYYNGRWTDVGTPQRLSELEQALIAQD